MLAYFLKANVAIALFYAFYRLFCLKDTFFGWCRAALMCFYAVAAAVPLLNLQAWANGQEPMMAMADLYASKVLPELIVTKEAGTYDWHALLVQAIPIIYIGGVAVMADRFLIQLAGIVRMHRRCPRTLLNGTEVHLLSPDEGPFSFFRWIFICPEAHTCQETDEILTHELTHVRQCHSVDVLVSEAACILCWFNPFAWLLKREVRINLEYLADAQVLATGHDSKSYQYHLLGLSHQKAAARIYNNFNVLPLKKRISMMNKKRSQGIGRAKYLLFLPLAALLLAVSNIEAMAREMQRLEYETKVEEEPTFIAVEQMPEFIEGGTPGLMKYIGQHIRYPEEALASGTQGRVVIQFIIEKDGTVSNVTPVRSVDPALDTEAVRVISTLPKFKPGMQRGQAVRVKNTIPVLFRMP